MRYYNQYVTQLKILILILLCPLYSYANNYLLPDQAFQVNIRQLSNQRLNVQFKIAQNYDIYQDKVKISTNPISSARLGEIKLPSAIKKHNDILGDYYVYQDTTNIIVPIASIGDGNLVMDITYQGCRGNEYCYPSISETKIITLNITPQINDIANNTWSFNKLLNANNSAVITNFFTNSFLMIILSFFVVGILLSVTPCVFPMLPILFTIVTGKDVGFKRANALAISYVLGMASAYATVGVIFASIGSSLQVYLQNSIMNYIIAIIFVIFSLSLFGLFDIRLPHQLQNKLFRREVHTNTILGTYFMGGISTLVLSPCVTAPLAGVLIYIASTGNILLGAIALFCLGVGSGLPLLIMAVFGNKIMPKNGVWLFLIKDLLAFLMICMCVFILGRELTSNLLHLVTGILLCMVGIYFILSTKYINLKNRWILTIVSVLIIFSSGCFLGYSLSQQNTFQKEAITTIVANSLGELDKELAFAKNKHLPVMLDFYASWCIACKELEYKTFANVEVVNLLKSFYVIKIDISNNDKLAQELMHKYNVIAPPSLVFYNREGIYLDQNNSLGYIDSDKLILILNNIKTKE